MYKFLEEGEGGKGGVTLSLKDRVKVALYHNPTLNVYNINCY